MKYVVITIRDIGTANHEVPMYVKHQNEAIRAVQRIVNEPLQQNAPQLLADIHDFPNQYELKRLGYWDSDTTEYTPDPLDLGQLSTFKRMN